MSITRRDKTTYRIANAGPKGADLYLHILSRDEAEEFLPDRDDKFITISITDPGSRLANLPTGIDRGCLGIHRVSFDDWDRQHHDRIVLMSREQALAIAEFVKPRIGVVRHIIVHCEAGISRSAGCAAAIGMYLCGDDSEIWQNFLPNCHVYRVMMYALKGKFER